jgi:hypothetical protein
MIRYPLRFLQKIIPALILIKLMIVGLTLTATAQLLTVKNAAITNTATITVKGDMTNETGAQLNNEGEIEVSGDFTNNSGASLFGTTTGTVVLNGLTQNINGLFPTEFHDLTLLGTGKKTLQQIASIDLTGTLSLGSQMLDLNTKTLTIKNPAPASITRSTGFIISETDPAVGYGIIDWNIGTGTGNYIFPFGNETTNSYLPVTMEITTPGNSSTGSIALSTYPTTVTNTPNNRPLPTGLTSLINYAGNENAQNVLDRWWVFDVTNYANQPTSSLTFTYRDSEWDASSGSTNAIVEGTLQAQSNNGLIWTPVLSGTINTMANTLTIPSINYYNPHWTLVGNNNPLPVEMLYFDATLNADGETDLIWVTASELNNDYFSLEKSSDGIYFSAIDTVDGSGNSVIAINYHAVDENPFQGMTYYRLKQVDFDGHFKYSEIRAVRKTAMASNAFNVYPNPASDYFYVNADLSITDPVVITDVNGKVVRVIDSSMLDATGTIRMDRNELVSGIYFVSQGKTNVRKLILM